MQTLCLFAKHWTPGRVKTRLAATVGEERAAEIYVAFVTTLLGRLAPLADRRKVYFAPIDQRPAFADLVGEGWELQPQEEGGLGERMAQLFDQELATGTNATVLLGTDSPNVPLEYIEAAFAALETAKVVLGPTDDGGYYLIGARGESPPLFDDLPFSTPQLWQATLDRLAEEGWQEGTDYITLPAWYDVDTESDLQHLRCDLQQLPKSADRLLLELLHKITSP